MRRFRQLILLLLGMLLTACVSFPAAPLATQKPFLETDKFVSTDGARLGYQKWEAKAPQAIIVAVHGMNDYSHGFAPAAQWWAANENISTYAIDLRGFGRSPQFGLWIGSETLKSDLRAFTTTVAMQFPTKPIYLVGHSMGAALVLSMIEDEIAEVEGAILVAPGVWGGSQLPILYRIAGNTAAIFAPGKTLTGERAKRQATDNIAILREMQKDPFMVRATRIDSVLGVTRLMGEGYKATRKLGGEFLVLYGEKDQIIPIKSMKKASERLCGNTTVKSYTNGWHLLLRDLNAQQVWEDIGKWIKKNTAGRGRVRGPAVFMCAD